MCLLKENYAEVEHFEKILRKDNVLNHYIQEDHLEGKIFYSMLDYQKNRSFRKDMLRKYEGQIYAIILKKDDIIPPFEVMNTLKGANRKYTHENPFPTNNEISQQIEKDFELVFKKVCDFYNNN